MMTRAMSILIVSLVLAELFSGAPAAAGPIKLTQVSNIVFGTAVQGDSAITVAAGTAETASNASFRVTGDANRSFTISLPAAPIQMEGPLPRKSNLISVSSFTSFPSGTSVLNATGSAMVYVGATRAALPSNIPAGSYSGAFSLTVVY